MEFLRCDSTSRNRPSYSTSEQQKQKVYRITLTLTMSCRYIVCDRLTDCVLWYLTRSFKESNFTTHKKYFPAPSRNTLKCWTWLPNLWSGNKGQHKIIALVSSTDASYDSWKLDNLTVLLKEEERENQHKILWKDSMFAFSAFSLHFANAITWGQWGFKHDHYVCQP